MEYGRARFAEPPDLHFKLVNCGANIPLVTQHALNYRVVDTQTVEVGRQPSLNPCQPCHELPALAQHFRDFPDQLGAERIGQSQFSTFRKEANLVQR